MQNKKTGSASQKTTSRLNAIGTILNKDQMKRIQGGACSGEIILCSLAGSCGAPVGGGYCCIANC